MNPMINRLTGARMDPIRNMINTIKTAQNPQMMLQQMAQKNPMLQQAMQYVNQNGGDARAAFYKLAQERGVDPETILQQLR